MATKLKDSEWQATFALIYTAVLLTVLEYGFYPPYLERWLHDVPAYERAVPSLEAGVIWGIACFVGYLVLPFLLVKIAFREKLKSIGLNFKSFFQHMKVYLGLYAFMLPVILIVAQRADFQVAYPFIPEAKDSVENFLIWQAVYILQFFALEAFFRGYLLFTLEKVVPRAMAIAVMVIPYTMIHFHKPPLETFGAVIAGCFLGWLALRYRSWAGGAIIHALVGVTMDFLSVHRSGLFDR